MTAALAAAFVNALSDSLVTPQTLVKLQAGKYTDMMKLGADSLNNPLHQP